MFHQARRKQKKEDRRLSLYQKCRKVYVSPDGQITKRKLRSVIQIKPSHFNKEEGWSFSYCAGEDINADKDRVLYFFHGILGHPFNWLDRKATTKLREHWRLKEQMPKWVSVSLGRLTFMAEQDHAEKFHKVPLDEIFKPSCSNMVMTPTL